MERDALSHASAQHVISGSGRQPDHAREYAVLASLADAVYCVDTAGRITFVNAAFEALSGYALAALQGTASTRLYVPEAEALLLERRRQVYSGAPVEPSLETVLLRHDGSRLPVALSVSSLIIAGQIAGRVGVVHDLSARQAAEEALRASEERFRHTFENAAVGIAHVGLDGDWLRANARLCEITGYTHEELLTRTFQDVTHPDDLETDLTYVRQVLSGAIATYAMEKRYIRKDGSIIWITLTVSLVRTPAGEPDYFISVVEDITSRKQAEKALRESAERLRAVIETAVDGIITIDERGQVEALNPAAVRLFGYAPEEVIGRNIAMLMPEPYQSEHDAYLARYVQTGRKKIIGIGREVVGRRQDGSTFPMDLAVSETQLDDRRLFTGIVRDISPRKAAEESLRRQARQQQAVAKLGELALRERAVQTVCEHAAATVAETLEVDYCEVLERLAGGEALRLRAGVGWQEGLVGTATVSTGRDSQAGYTLLADAPVVVEDLRQEQRFSGPPMLSAHGVISSMSYIIRGAGGTPWGVLGAHSTRRLTFTPDDVNFLAAVANILSDAIARERAEAALRESEARFELLANAAPVLIWVNGPDGCEFVNRPYLEFLGVASEADVRGYTWGQYVHPDDREVYVGGYRAAVAARRPFAAQFRFRRADGGYRWFQSVGTPRLLLDGTFLGYVGCSFDITEMREAEAELLRARKLESVGVLAGGIAHDFNNLLTGILGNISLAKARLGAEAHVVARLTEAEKACQRATALTQQLLTFATGGAPVRQRVSLAHLLPEALTFALRGANVRGAIRLAADLWPVDADPGQMSQVFHHVVRNAVQAMPGGGTVEVRADNVVLGADAAVPLPAGHYVHIAVQDHGGGIPRDVLPQIFDPYFTTKAAGSGLGLATAHAIVAKHEGYISVDSAVGVGTTVVLYLPASQQPVTPAPPRADIPRGGPERILVMDDEDTICDLLREFLTSLGYEVECVGEGSAAIAAYQRAQAAGHPFAAVILDSTIPGGMGGRDTIAHLRTLNPQVVALLSSGYTNDPLMANYAQYGFRGIVAKPYTVHTLQETLQRVLQEGHVMP